MLTGCHSNSSPASKWRRITRHHSTLGVPPCLRRSRRPEMTSATTTVTWPSHSTVPPVHNGTVPNAHGTVASNSRFR